MQLLQHQQITSMPFNYLSAKRIHTYFSIIYICVHIYLCVYVIAFWVSAYLKNVNAVGRMSACCALALNRCQQFCCNWHCCHWCHSAVNQRAMFIWLLKILLFKYYFQLLQWARIYYSKRAWWKFDTYNWTIYIYSLSMSFLQNT